MLTGHPIADFSLSISQGRQPFGLSAARAAHTRPPAVWAKKDDPISKQQKFYDDQLKEIQKLQIKFGEQRELFAQEQAKFSEYQDAWTADWKERMDQPRYVNVGGQQVKSEEVGSHIDQLKIAETEARRQDLDVYQQELSSLASNPRYTTGVKTVKGIPEPTKFYTPKTSFSRDSMRIKNTQVNI